MGVRGMRFYDAFHGIGGFRYGLEQAGMTCVGGSEIDKYACKAYGVINNEQCEPTDIRGIIPERLPDFDVFVGGFPCQDLSIAGQRKGFDGERSILFFEILRICRVKKPSYILLENVTGLLSHNEGETFETVLNALDELGYDAEWQVHNSAAYVPQNRERIFIIASARGISGRKIFPFGAENQNAIEVVGRLEGNHDQNSRVYGSGGVSPCLSTMQGGGQEPKVLVNATAKEITKINPGESDIQNSTCTSKENIESDSMRDMRNKGKLGRSSQGQKLEEQRSEESAKCLQELPQSDSQSEEMHDMRRETQGSRILQQTSDTVSEVRESSDVLRYRIRKLTVLECFRLQSFPDWWYYKCKEHDISDSQLYKMAGNAVTSAVAYEIGKRLMG